MNEGVYVDDEYNVEFFDIKLEDEGMIWEYSAYTDRGPLRALTVANPTGRELIDALLSAYKTLPIRRLTLQRDYGDFKQEV